MRMLGRWGWCLLGHLAMAAIATMATTAWGSGAVTDAEVYRETLLLERETRSLAAGIGVSPGPIIAPLRLEARQRHVWQQTSLILTKMNLFRRNHHLPMMTGNTLEPVLEVSPALALEEVMRLVTEVRILKAHLGVPGDVGVPELEPERTVTDVFERLHALSDEWDRLNGTEIPSVFVFGEALRLREDVDALFEGLRLADDSFPPAKEPDALPADSLAAAVEVLGEIQRLQRIAGIERLDFSPFMKFEDVRSGDVFQMVGLCLAELQPVKARLDLAYRITPPAVYRGVKTQAEVHQLLRWTAIKLRQIQALR